MLLVRNGSEKGEGNMRERQAGFTLIELLVVVAIIGFLAAIAIPQYMSYKRSSLDAASESVIHNLATALEGYFVANQTYGGATLANLETSYGYKPSQGVTAGITEVDGTHYVITASAAGGNGTLTFDSRLGAISGP